MRSPTSRAGFFGVIVLAFFQNSSPQLPFKLEELMARPSVKHP